MENKIQIAHVADIQVKDRNLPLYKSSADTLLYIEEVIRKRQIPIYVISGDLFEYPNPNESERKLIYNHIVRLLNIDTLKELVIICGNHDLVKENKQELNQKDYNAMSIFADVIKHFDSKKLRYFNKSGVYNSTVSERIKYYIYSLEDDCNIPEDQYTSDYYYRICLYHAMIKEYVEYDKLPLSKNQISKLDSLDKFPDNSLILAGDIHKTLVFDDKSKIKRFVYPGSIMQHTFSEGNYLNVGNTTKYLKAESKSIMLYTVQGTTVYDFGIDTITIPNYISYNTMVLDSKVPYDVIKYQLENVSLETGINQTLLKIKSSNIFISKERDIYNVLTSKFNNIQVSFEYDKFIDNNKFVENKVVQEIIDTKSSELKENNTIIIDSNNIDNLLLNSEQLSKLFDSVLCGIVNGLNDEFKHDELIHDINGIFASELQKTTEKQSTRYNIKLLSIKTNNFMLLGNNDINLDIPGVIRILGTNGIGKTTLYRMIRWCLTGMIFEGMSGNQAVKNNLLVFNKKRPDENIVSVTLNTSINGQRIEFKRFVERVWKQNVTDEQKLSQNWTDYVSNLKRDFSITIHPLSEEKQPKTFTGNEAERLVSIWFGSVINNILFLNQEKITSILNAPSDKLNELILEYIGVDYLQKLEDNLDTVKMELLSIEKPKRNLEAIRESIIDTDIFLNKNTADLEQKKSELDVVNTNKNTLDEQLRKVNDNLIAIGDIQMQLDETRAEKLRKETTLSEYVVLDLKEKQLPVFNEEKPVIDNVSISSFANNKERLEKELSGVQENLKENQQKIDDFKNKLFDVVKQMQTEESNTKEEYSNNVIELHKKEREIFNKIFDYVHDIKTKLEDKIAEKRTLIGECKSNINNYNQQINELNKQIEAGICPTCKRPFEDDFETHKKTIINKTDELRVLCDDEEGKINDTEEFLKRAETLRNKYSEIEKYAASLDNKVFDFDENTVISYRDQILEIQEKTESYNKLIENCYQNIININKLMDIYNGNYDTEIHTETIDTMCKIHYNLVLHKKEIESKIIEYQESINAINKQIQDIKDEYNSKLTAYTDKFENYKKELSEVQQYNESVRNKLQEISNLKLIIQQLQTKILQFETKLPEFNKLLEEKNNIAEKIDEEKQHYESLNRDINALNIKQVSYENQKELFQKEYDNNLLYQKNNLIWKIYSKLIKNNFKDIVFDYYRTYLNKTLNYLLSDVNFKLYWNQNSELTMISCDNGLFTYQSVHQSSGMETTFLGLSLIYTIHLLNVKNCISHIFIDEISGTLNKGTELSYQSENYQELFVKILSKFKDKSIFIVDHAVNDLHENACYEVIPNGVSSKFVSYNG